ncbi:hypothetical protein FHS41_001047 [Streptomyces violarus]|uniref:Uncharacterized protein n=1 Tax=Streptomyces violarus TaxID=67380 RepID=A0A7W4ZL96_9ACTN|nr:hypothetical protein [Streptomyces violarus]
MNIEDALYGVGARAGGPLRDVEAQAERIAAARAAASPNWRPWASPVSAWARATPRAAHAPVRRAARELLDTGTYGSLADALDYGEINALLERGR